MAAAAVVWGWRFKWLLDLGHGEAWGGGERFGGDLGHRPSPHGCPAYPRCSPARSAAPWPSVRAHPPTASPDGPCNSQPHVSCPQSPPRVIPMTVAPRQSPNSHPCSISCPCISHPHTSPDICPHAGHPHVSPNGHPPLPMSPHPSQCQVFGMRVMVTPCVPPPPFPSPHSTEGAGALGCCRGCCSWGGLGLALGSAPPPHPPNCLPFLAAPKNAQIPGSPRSPPLSEPTREGAQSCDLQQRPSSIKALAGR